MCGHGMVSFNLVRDTFDEVKEGRMTVAEGVTGLDRPCTCGIVNPVRTRAILEKPSKEA